MGGGFCHRQLLHFVLMPVEGDQQQVALARHQLEGSAAAGPVRMAWRRVLSATA